MLRFQTENRRTPATRSVDDRKSDFKEITQAFSPQHLKTQAERCAQCGVPFCQTGCPLGNHIPDWLNLAAAGRLREAYLLSASTNNMPEICGRICPQDRLCEKACVLEESQHGAVTIGAVEKEITEHAWASGWVEAIRPARERDQSVGIVGSGPAGLAAAEELRKWGYDVSVYDRHDRMGGLLTYGIPGFKLDKEVVERRLRRLEEGGVKFHSNVHVGRSISFQELRARHDSVLIATGTYKPKPLGLGDLSARNVVKALDYLIASNRCDFGDRVEDFASGRLNARDRRVVVIGGGDTAMDCVRTAVRQGAKTVTCIYRRDQANMPGSRREVQYAIEEGVQFFWLTQPTGFEMKSDVVTAVKTVRTELGAPDSSGRRVSMPVEGSGSVLEADLVIEALGFDAEDLPRLFQEPELQITAAGTLTVDGAGQTTLPGVFAAGDIVRGPSLVVWAIRDGRECSAKMHEHMSAQVRRKQEGLVNTL